MLPGKAESAKTRRGGAGRAFRIMPSLTAKNGAGTALCKKFGRAGSDRHGRVGRKKQAERNEEGDGKRDGLEHREKLYW